MSSQTDKTTVTDSNRRQFLRGLTALMGATAVSQLASAKSLAVALDYVGRPNSEKQAGKLFSHAQMSILHDVCDVVLPKTDTPSAAELDVHGFIDHQLVVCHNVEQQEQAKAVINKIDAQSVVLHQKRFIELSALQQQELLIAVEQGAKGFGLSEQQQFKALKSLIVFGFFTTEIGATIALKYQAVPGGFTGSVPYQEIGKSYGSLAYY